MSAVPDPLSCTGQRQQWPQTLLYTFPPVVLILTTPERGRRRLIYDSDRPSLAQENVVYGDHCTVGLETLVPPCAQKFTVSGSGIIMAPAPRNLGSVGLAPNREKVMATGLPDREIDTIQSAKGIHTGAV